MTADEYLALGETFERYERIDGVVVVSPSPGLPHNEIAAEITGQFVIFSRARRTIRLFPETDLRLSDGRVYRPDLCVYLKHRLAPGVRRLSTPPDLVVEILSPGNQHLDLDTKRNHYEAFGVGEYWVVDPENGSVRSWRRHESRLIEVKVEGDTLPCASIVGFALELPPIREIAANG